MAAPRNLDDYRKFVNFILSRRIGPTWIGYRDDEDDGTKLTYWDSKGEFPFKDFQQMNEDLFDHCIYAAFFI